MLCVDHLAEVGPFLFLMSLCVCQSKGVCLTFFDAASAGLPLITVLEGSVFFAYQYLLPFEQKHESQ